METPQLLATITDSAKDIKALDLVVIDMEEKSAVTDFLVICHGTSTAHTRGIADRVAMTLKQKGIRPLGIEGQEQGQWILIDYNTVILHIFLEDIREHYSIEEIYQTCPRREH